jgi:DNA repair protein RecO (recombination protein O)
MGSNWQRAFVLHSRPYSETSLLIDFFVETKGRVTIIAKGARRKRSAQKGILQPFTPLIIQYSGNSHIKTLKHVEAISLTLPLSRYYLYSAFYVNELIQRVVMAESDTIQLFRAYLDCLQHLACQHHSPEYTLRHFELCLLEYLGYQIDFEHCYGTGDAIISSMTYQFHPEKGFIASVLNNSNTFKGQEIQALAKRHFANIPILNVAKRFTRMALKPYVGSQPFKSRELFRTK